MYDPIVEPVLPEPVKPVVEPLPPAEKLTIRSEPTSEKCLCEKARGWLEESIHNPINYHPEEVYDYGSRALRDIGDDERYYEEVKGRCECRKRKHGVMASTIELAYKLGMKPLSKDVGASKKRCFEKSNIATSTSTASSSSSTPVEVAIKPNEEVKATKEEVDDPLPV